MKPPQAPSGPTPSVPARALVASLTALLALSLATAGEPTLEDLLQTEVQAVSRQLERSLDAPATVYLLPAEVALALGHETLTDMLNRLPGVYVGSQRSYATVGLRGFSRPGDYNARILMSVDGMRVNDGVFDQALPGLEFPLALPWIKRVELVGGPAGSVYGGNALLGVVNVVTLDGADRPGWHWQASTGGQRSREAGLSWGHHSGDTDFLLGLQSHQRDGESLQLPQLAAAGVADGWVHGLDGERAHHLLLKLRHRSARLSLGSQARIKQLATAPYGSVAGEPGTRFIDRYHFAEGVFDPGWQADLRPVLRASLVRSRFDGRYLYEGEPDPADRVVNVDVIASNVATIDARLQWRGWLNHGLTAGVEWRRVAKARQFNADEQPAAVYLDRQDSFAQWGLFGQDQWRLSERHTLTLGLRLDRPDGFGVQLSPRLALVWRPREGEALKLMLGKAFRAPNLAERFYEDGLTQIANPGLEPERVATAELAWERRLASHLRLAASAYHYRLKGLIDFVPLSEDLAQYQNASGTTADGADLDLEGRHARGLRWRLSASWVRARSGSQRLSNSPGWLLKGHMLQPLGSAWSLGLQAQAMASRSAPTGDVPAWATADAALSWRRGPHTLSLRVLNLANAAHADPGSPENNLSRVPGQRRRWVLTWRAAL